MSFQLTTPAVLLLGMLVASAASDAASAEEPPIFSISNAPAAPPESAEARIALRQHRESSALNRFTFKGNVLEGTGDIVDHWIVMFCPGWHDKCQGLLPSYELLGVQWENKLNKDLMSSKVRFAKVDCATEKALCVSLDIDDYPSVVHYRQNERVASWHGGAPGLVRFVKQELEGPKRRPSQAVAPKAKISPVCAEAGIIIPDDSASGLGHQWHIARTLCFAMLLLVAARYVWKLLPMMRSGHASCASTSTLQSSGARRCFSGPGHCLSHECLQPAPGATNSEAAELPYGGDVQAAMKAQDRDAIRKIMAHRTRKERGEQEPAAAPPAEAPAAVPAAVKEVPPRRSLAGLVAEQDKQERQQIVL